MSTLFKRTKILATIGPAVYSEQAIEDLIMAGVNGCRLNFSHGDYKERDQQIEWIRKAAAKKGRSVAILQDLQGPKIRLGEIQNNHFDVHVGDELILDNSITEHDGSNIIPVQYNLAERMKVGEPLSMFDGKVKSHVTDIVSKTAVKVKIENEGFIMSHKGLNLPDTDFGGDIITEKDMADIEFGASRDFDYVAMSFIQSAEDIDKLRQILLSHGSTAQIIAKIETKKAIENDEVMEAIVEASDGIMVARGDMAVEAGNEVVPTVQRKLVALCRKHAKLCIVATQMMGSMVDNPEPSRAEVSDVANAVIQGADVVMLSDETANGKYPVEAVKQMKKVILYSQNHSYAMPFKDFVKSIWGPNTPGNSTPADPVHERYTAMSRSAARVAEQIGADAIICQTASGATAAAIAAERPNVPIISVTSNARVAGQLALCYANSAFVRPYSDTYGIDIAQELKESGYIPAREDGTITVVLVSGQPNTEGGTDTIQVRRI
ncbi:MAG: pyruvate kinase [Candidatus Saccharibacteria bacterium]|nr:pyruvate kinase [Candidatus Saccharibacteria bacterium]